MKFSIVLVTALVLFLSTSLGMAQSDYLFWNGTSEELIKHVNSSDENKITFALQKIILNPKIPNSNAVSFKIYRLYRSHPNDKIRQMALVALYRLEDFYLLKNLREDIYGEKNQEIRKQILYILDKVPVLSKLK